MLILSRRPGESIIIGSEIEVKILGWKDGQLSIGIVAPKAVTIYRREVYDAICEENRQAARPVGIDLSSFPIK